MTPKDPKAGWVPLAGKDAEAWARIFGTSWKIFLKAIAPDIKNAVRRWAADAQVARGVSVGKWADTLSGVASMKSRGLAQALDALERSKLKISLFNVGRSPAIVVHKSDLGLNTRGNYRGVAFPVESKAHEVFDEVRVDVHRVPYVSDVLDNATGIPWLFETNALDQHEVARLVRGSRYALRDPDVRAFAKGEAAAALSRPGPSPLKPRPHFPVRLPRFARVAHIFHDNGRPAGWAAVGGAALDVLSVMSFASFLKGNNPGFVAQVLWKDPWVALPIALMVNRLHNRKRRKEARARALAAWEHVQKEKEREIREMLARREDRVVRRRYQVGRSMVQLRYGLAGILRR